MGVVWTFFYSRLSFLSLPLFGRRPYLDKYCLKGPLNPKQRTNKVSCNYSPLSGTFQNAFLDLYIVVATVDTEYWGGGWSGGAMVLGKLPVPGRPTILITVGQGPIALAVGAGGGGLEIFTLIYPFSSFSLSLGDGPI